MIYKIPVRTFRFNQPKLIQEHEYVELKKFITAHPFTELVPKGDFREEFKSELLMFKILAIAFTVAAFIQFSFIGKEGFLVPVVGISMFGAIFWGVFTVPEMLSFNKYQRKRDEYLKKLKGQVLSSSDYTDFRNKFNNHH